MADIPDSSQLSLSPLPSSQLSPAAHSSHRLAPRLKWDPAMLSTLLNTLIESHTGLSTTVKPEVQQRVLAAVQSITSQPVTAAHIKNKYDILRRDFKLWYRF